MEHGVPERAIILEPDGRTTMQSLQACTKIMQEHRLQTAILVSDPFHAFRLRRISHDLHIGAVVSPTPYNPLKSPGERVKRNLHEVAAYAGYQLLGL
jgi:uncharacterized SAM-binding protein YcdF (DUF218 family)